MAISVLPLSMHYTKNTTFTDSKQTILKKLTYSITLIHKAPNATIQTESESTFICLIQKIV